MPEYDYGCPDCGPFSAVRPMAEYDRPVGCPDCGTPAPRVILTVPNLAMMDASRRVAASTNERSANAPTRFKADGGHGAACGCCRPAPKLPAVKGKAGGRPWMIGH